MDDGEASEADGATAAEACAAEAREGTRLMVSGVGLGAIGAASAAVLGATCPVCVVGAPALVGWGAYRRWRARRQAGSALSGEPTEDDG